MVQLSSTMADAGESLAQEVSQAYVLILIIPHQTHHTDRYSASLEVTCLLLVPVSVTFAPLPYLSVHFTDLLQLCLSMSISSRFKMRYGLFGDANSTLHPHYFCLFGG